MIYSKYPLKVLQEVAPFPPIQNTASPYIDEAAMHADQANQLEGYGYLVDGVGAFTYLGTVAGTAADYKGFGGGTLLDTPTILSTYDLQNIKANNAPIPLIIPTYDGSGKNVHPSVLYFPNKFNEWYYWMAITPYPNGDNTKENPSIIVSNDKYNWVVPSGVTNPIVDKPVDGFNSDPELIQGYDNKLYLYWREKDSDLTYERLYVISSIDGITWSSRTLVYDNLDYATQNAISPCVIKKDGDYHLYYGSQTMLRRISSNPLTFEGVTEESVSVIGMPIGSNIWHYGMRKVDNTLYCIVNDTLGSSIGNNLLFGVFDSTGLILTLNPLINKGGFAWNTSALYRPSFVALKTSYKGITFGMWYSAVGSGFMTGYTEFSIGAVIEKAKPLVSIGSIALNNIYGNYYNMWTASTLTVFTLDEIELGGYSIIKINTATEPSVTGATKIKGSTFIQNTNMYLNIQYIGGNSPEYYFTEI